MNNLAERFQKNKETIMDGLKISFSQFSQYKYAVDQGREIISLDRALEIEKLTDGDIQAVEICPKRFKYLLKPGPFPSK